MGCDSGCGVRGSAEMDGVVVQLVLEKQRHEWLRGHVPFISAETETRIYVPPTDDANNVVEVSVSRVRHMYPRWLVTRVNAVVQFEGEFDCIAFALERVYSVLKRVGRQEVSRRVHVPAQSASHVLGVCPQQLRFSLSLSLSLSLSSRAKLHTIAHNHAHTLSWRLMFSSRAAPCHHRACCWRHRRSNFASCV
jgi:hypothetical protein